MVSIFELDHHQWQMSWAERCALIVLLQELKPQCAIEVGTAQGGSLSVLAEYCQKVYSLDIDPLCKQRLQKNFPNVEFVIGNSEETLPSLIELLKKRGETPGFVLIDGDHRTESVKRDIESILTFHPGRPLYIVMHDSFNPGCRRGILEAAWEDNPYVHSVELDFIQGGFCADLEFFRQMWGGLALATMLPTKRESPLKINQNQRLLFETTLGHSMHKHTVKTLIKNVVSILGYKLSGIFAWIKGIRYT